ncbi:MAG: Zn-dependent hydrolase [Myxococcales bacterium]|nr:Zn-dependent hydrolase [Myxococcales bacterium]
MAEALRIDARRLAADLDALSRIGRVEGGGLDRRAFGDGDRAGRAWLAQRIRDAGFAVHVDGAANLGTCLPGSTDLPCVMTGSHIDTVPGAGQLDGALGVLCGLEALRTLAERGPGLARTVELVAFSDEEGRFGGMLGSQAMSGQLTPDAIERARDLDGTTLVEAMAAAGHRAHDALGAEREAGSIHAYVELHIEQGPVLERTGHAIGVVDAITGLFRWDVRLLGETNHAGTTPMDMRRDAFQGLAEVAAQIDRVLEENGGPRSRATVGRVDLVPGAANVIPGEARFALEVRDTDAHSLSELSTAFRRAFSAVARRRDLRFEYEVVSELAPVACDARVVDAARSACAALGTEPLAMPSGAAHDAQMIARIAPAGMIFVPSRAGRSHSPAEWTSPADIELGANVLLHALVELAR